MAVRWPGDTAAALHYCRWLSQTDPRDALPRTRRVVKRWTLSVINWPSVELRRSTCRGKCLFSNFKVRNKDPAASDSIPLFWRFQNFFTAQCRTSSRLAGGETICPPPPIAVRLAADLRPSADGSAGHTWLSCRQPACLQPNAAARLVQLRHGTDRQTYGRIAVSLNFPSYGGDIISRGYIACVKNEFDSLGCFDIEYRHFSTLCAIEIK